MHSVRIPVALTFCEYPFSIFLCLGGQALLPSAHSPTSPVGQEIHNPAETALVMLNTERSHHACEQLLSSFLLVALSACFCLSPAVFPLCSHSQILLDKPDIRRIPWKVFAYMPEGKAGIICR